MKCNCINIKMKAIILMLGLFAGSLFDSIQNVQPVAVFIIKL